MASPEDSSSSDSNSSDEEDEQQEKEPEVFNDFNPNYDPPNEHFANEFPPLHLLKPTFYEEDPLTVVEELSDIINDKTLNFGEFSFGGVAFQFPTIAGPDLNVSGIGPLRFPLPHYQAEVLIDWSGLDEEKWYEIQASELAIRNQELAKGIGDLTREIAARFGCAEAGLEFELVKFVLLGPEEGIPRQADMVKAVERQVGTLVLQMPSMCEGRVKVYRGVEEAEWLFERSKEKTEDADAIPLCHFVFYQLGGELEVLKASGYRSFLFVSICWPSGKEGVMKTPDQETAARVVPLLQDLRRESHNYLVLFMTHHYEEKKLRKQGWRCLTANDCGRFKLLRDANDMLPDRDQFQLFLTTVTHTYRFFDTNEVSNYWTPDEAKWKFFRMEPTYTPWLRPDGSLDEINAEKPKLDLLSGKNVLRQHNRYLQELWGPVGIHKYEGYTRDRKVTKESVYKRQVLILWSKKPSVSAALTIMGFKAAFRVLISRSASSKQLWMLMDHYRYTSDRFDHKIAPSLLAFILRNRIELLPDFFDIFRGIFEPPRNWKLQLVFVDAMKSPDTWDMVQPYYFAELSHTSIDPCKRAIEVIFLAQKENVPTSIRQELIQDILTRLHLRDYENDELVSLLWVVVLREGDHFFLNQLQATTLLQIPSERLNSATEVLLDAEIPPVLKGNRLFCHAVVEKRLQYLRSLEETFEPVPFMLLPQFVDFDSIEDYMNSDNEDIQKFSLFTNRREAKHFVERLQRHRHLFYVAAAGKRRRGQRAHVWMKKSPALIENQRMEREQREIRDEIKQLEAILEVQNASMQE